jgi:small ligand-binding sensory domain FIST
MRHDELDGSGTYRHGDIDAHIDAYRIEYGSVSITPVANTPTAEAVTFDTPFTSVPKLFVNPHTAYPGTQVLGVSASGITTDGCNVYITRTNTTSTVIDWMAVGT